ncbi:MAG: spondin domain-containing protein [Desulfobulbaceae bacterium]|nr:spondin domain-containing protein [Desulfobulbaceae bacterium]
MNKKKTKLFLTLWCCVAGLGLGFAGTSQASTIFKVSITNLSPNVLTPMPLVTHNSNFDLFSQGAAASAEVEGLAESGDAPGIIGLAAAAPSTDVFDYIVASGAPLGPGASASVMISADPAYSLLSYMSMLAISNDGFIGGTTGDGAISLFNGGLPSYGTYTIMPLDVWDAGTEVNDELAANVPALGGMGSIDEGGVVSRIFNFGSFTIYGHPGIMGIADIPVENNWRSGAVAEINIEAVPIPGAVWLLGSGLFSLICARRKWKT